MQSREGVAAGGVVVRVKTKLIVKVAEARRRTTGLYEGRGTGYIREKLQADAAALRHGGR